MNFFKRRRQTTINDHDAIEKAQVLYLKGLELEQTADYHGALNHFNDAIKFDPNNRKLLKVRDRVLEEIALYDLAYNNHPMINSDGQLEVSIEYLEKLLQLNPSDNLTRDLLSTSYYLIGKHDNAIHHLQILVNHHPNTPESCGYMLSLGINYFVQGNAEEGFYHMERSLEHTLTPQQLATRLGLIGAAHYLNSNKKTARKIWRQTIDIDPHSFAIQYSMGIVYGEQGNVREAINSFEKAVQLDKKRVELVDETRNLLSAGLTFIEEAEGIEKERRIKTIDSLVSHLLGQVWGIIIPDPSDT